MNRGLRSCSKTSEEMNKIIESRFIAPDVKLFKIYAPYVAEKRKPGQFVVLRVHELGERVPITIADADTNEGSITIIVQGIGKTTKQLNMLGAGDYIHDLVGPLGKPTHVEKWGRVVCVSGGVGTAEALPIAKALKEAGNEVISIIGARTKALVIAEKEIAERSDEVIITTDDGSYGKRGMVTRALQELLNGGRDIDFVLAIGPLLMMKAVAEVTRPLDIPTVVSLNSIMIDGTGMCGGCRATVGGKTVFVCVDGPEFDAHQVDFDLLEKRQRIYIDEEKSSLKKFEEKCKLDKEIEKVVPESSDQSREDV